MHKKLFLSLALLTQFQLIITGDDPTYPWDAINLFDDFPPSYTLVNQPSQVFINDDNNSISCQENSYSTNYYNNSSSSSCNSLRKRLLEDSCEQNNEKSKKSNNTSNELVKKNFSNFTWNDTYKEFEYYTNKNELRRLPSEPSLLIISYLNASQNDKENIFNNFSNAFRSVNGTKLINYLSIIDFQNKIQSIQEPYLPTRPHLLTDPTLMEFLCNPKKLIHQSIVEVFPAWSQGTLIYQTEDQKNSYYRTHYWIMKKLLEHGVDPNIYINSHEYRSSSYVITPLSFASEFNQEFKTTDSPNKTNEVNEEHSANLINLLLEYKANPNKKNYTHRANLKRNYQYHTTPLLAAVESHNKAAVQALLDHSSSKKSLNTHINTKYHSGNSALHVAVNINNPEIVEVLLRYKINTEIKNNSNETPLHLIIKKSRTPYFSTIADMKTMLEKSLKITKLLLENGADKTALDRHSRTPMNVVSNELNKIQNDNNLSDKKKCINQYKIKFYQDIIDLLSR